ncbi:hypothetical protein ACFOEE_10180 [Pseudoalteromonas fenneropenaei]|uniref:Uncharacterized protein n=1 Tax=Pseudoalteromonas fenneropenaei TaxID=1737459 RepID=A0ABV7CK00_9GAMM
MKLKLLFLATFLGLSSQAQASDFVSITDSRFGAIANDNRAGQDHELYLDIIL